jgi:hypothetical protein
MKNNKIEAERYTNELMIKKNKEEGEKARKKEEEIRREKEEEIRIIQEYERKNGKDSWKKKVRENEEYQKRVEQARFEGNHEWRY